VSPRPADPAIRGALLNAAARILAAEGPRALTVRRLAAEVGASTMAIYSHFGSMDEIRLAIRGDGFARLTTRTATSLGSDDPVAALAATGIVYLDSALGDPALYRAMFVDQPPRETENAGAELFRQLVSAVQRCVDAERFDRVEAAGLVSGWAAQLWAMWHGMVTLAITGTQPPHVARFLLDDMTYRLFVGYGDDPAAARLSISRATAATATSA
jgi:AcrR family transcriptional regulator